MKITTFKQTEMKKNLNLLLLSFIISVIPSHLYAREFLNTVLHLNFGGMYSFTTKGNIFKTEERAAENAFGDTGDSSHYESAYVVTLDVVPMKPVILGLESNAIKFGVRAVYSFNFIQQSITATDEYGDQLMDYRTWMIGPVIHFAPFIDPSDINNEYTASSGFTCFALYGRMDGNLTAYPAIRDAGITTGDFQSGLSGSKFNIGLGAEIALCSLNFGMNVYYSYSRFRLDEEIYTGSGKEFYLKEGCLEIYIGIPIETIIRPLIPNF